MSGIRTVPTSIDDLMENNLNSTNTHRQLNNHRQHIDTSPQHSLPQAFTVTIVIHSHHQWHLLPRPNWNKHPQKRLDTIEAVTKLPRQQTPMSNSSTSSMPLRPIRRYTLSSPRPSQSPSNYCMMSMASVPTQTIRYLQCENSDLTFRETTHMTSVHIKLRHSSTPNMTKPTP